MSYGIEARQSVGTDLMEVDSPGCYGCSASARPGAVWYMGLDAKGQAHFSCFRCQNGLFNVFKVRAEKRAARANDLC